MKTVIAGGLTLAVLIALHIPALKKKRGIVLALYALGMILFFAVYNVRTLDFIIKFYHPSDQSMYQEEFLDDLEYPDAFLGEFFKGKTVYTPNDAYEVRDDIDVNNFHDFDGPRNHWLYYYYHAVNMWDYLSLSKADIVKDDSLNDIILDDEQRGYFEDFGPANDMLRYTFALTPYTGEWGNGFYYYWFYNSFIGESRVYVCPQDIKDADELVMIWQHEYFHDTDSYFIASKKYYDEVIAK